MQFETVIANAKIIDGTGRPRYPADLGIKDGLIAAISPGERLQAARVIDASGLVVAPGFIDVHSHSDWVLPQPDHAEILAPLLLQGITTVVAGHCGFSPAPVLNGNTAAMDGISAMLRDSTFPYRWSSFGEFLDAMQAGGLLLNAAFLVGHGSLRAQVMGSRPDVPEPQEMECLRDQTRQALWQGAFGLSTGLAYAPGVFAKNRELVELMQVAAQEEAIVTVHGRAYTWVSPFYKPMFLGTPHNVRSVRELIDLARQARVKLQLSHQLFVGRRTWRTYRTVLNDIDQAANEHVQAAFDAYPYTVGNTTIKIVFPEWFLDGFEAKINDPACLRRLKREITLLQWALGIRYADIRLMASEEPSLAELHGLDFESIARRLGLSPYEAYIHVARVSRGRANVLLGAYSGDDENEEPLQAALAHPLCSFMTDTILTRNGLQNPASFGTYPRLLGRYCRDIGLFSLEEAVRRMTSYPAERIGLQEVGVIREGAWADLVLFDAESIADNTTPQQTEAPPTGIRLVMISGQVAARDGRVEKASCGRVLRK